LATLKYGILENKGFLLLTGEVGVGKTVLINYLVDLLHIETIIATIPDPDLTSLDFFHFLADGFGMDQNFTTKSEFLIALRGFLYNSYSNDQKVLLIIDEAQRLSRERLEEIRLLSNIELNHSKLINIFFVGQSEFNDTLADEQCRAVRQRITVNYNIEPLDEEETLAFIKHRLKVAGASQLFFTRPAIREIFAFSGGTPRLINIVCDHALLTGYARGLKKIDADVINECAEDLKIPTSSSRTAATSSGVPSPAKEGEAAKGSPTAETAAKAVPDTSATPSSPTGRSVSMGIIIAVVLVVLMLSAGYFLYLSLGVTRAPKWSADQLTPKKYQETLQREKESLADQISGKTKPTDQSESPEASSPPVAEAPIPAAPASEESAPTVSGNTGTAADAVSAIDPDQVTTISFSSNSNDIPSEAIPKLDAIAAFMLKNPAFRIEIRGYTDSTGSRTYNENVSRFRASAIKSYLTGKGANPDNMVPMGLGPKDNIASNDSLEGRRKNRRVEIQFFPGKQNG